MKAVDIYCRLERGRERSNIAGYIGLRVGNRLGLLEFSTTKIGDSALDVFKGVGGAHPHLILSTTEKKSLESRNVFQKECSGCA